jgi:hypothetical protein
LRVSQGDTDASHGCGAKPNAERDYSAESRSLSASRVRQTVAGKKKRGTPLGMTRSFLLRRIVDPQAYEMRWLSRGINSYGLQKSVRRITDALGRHLDFVFVRGAEGDVVELELAIEGGAADAKHSASQGLIATGFFEHAEDGHALEVG